MFKIGFKTISKAWKYIKRPFKSPQTASNELSQELVGRVRACENTVTKPAEVPVRQPFSAQNLVQSINQTPATVRPPQKSPRLPEQKAVAGEVEPYEDLASDSLFSFAKRHPIRTPEGQMTSDGLALVRLDDDIPLNGVLRTTRDKITGEFGSKGARDSLHFSVNHPVKKLEMQGDSWDTKKYSYIMPFDEVKNLVGGSPVDMYTKGSVKLSNGTVIVRRNPNIPKGKLRVLDTSAIDEFKAIKAGKVIETSETPHAATSQILKKLGYDVKEGGNFCWNDVIDRDFIDLLGKKGMFSAVHMATPNAKIENSLSCMYARSLYNKKWNVLSKNNELLIDYKKEFLGIIKQAEELHKEFGYPLDFDTKQLTKIVEESKTPKEAFSKIQQDMKLTSLTYGYQIPELDEFTYANTLASLAGSSNPFNTELAKKAINFIQGKAENTAAEYLTNIQNWMQKIIEQQG